MDTDNFVFSVPKDWDERDDRILQAFVAEARRIHEEKKTSNAVTEKNCDLIIEGGTA